MLCCALETQSRVAGGMKGNAGVGPGRVEIAATLMNDGGKGGGRGYIGSISIIPFLTLSGCVCLVLRRYGLVSFKGGVSR